MASILSQPQWKTTASLFYIVNIMAADLPDGTKPPPEPVLTYHNEAL